MIRIHKPATAPAILRNRGQREMAEIKVAFDADPDAYLSGDKKFEFSSSIYGAKSVKNALKKAQHGKCCFCEAKVTHVAYGDVEHFRPKKGYRQKSSDDLGRPGYYWRAYHWPNLYFSCQICNQRHKRNLFPLIDPTQRAIDHDDDQENEEPLFLDPGHVDPKDHISFRHEVAFPIEDSATGEATINGLGLNRPEILEDRLKHLTTLVFIRIVANMDGPERENARAYLDKTTNDDAEYASMTRAFLASAAD